MCAKLVFDTRYTEAVEFRHCRLSATRETRGSCLGFFYVCSLVINGQAQPFTGLGFFCVWNLGMAMDKTEAANNVSGFERHVQTLLALLALAVMTWGGNKFSESVEAQIRTEERLKVIESKLDRLEQADMAGELATLRARVSALERERGMQSGGYSRD